jgi:hypothetical protein
VDRAAVLPIGLTSVEAQQRLAAVGPNAVAERSCRAI